MINGARWLAPFFLSAILFKSAWFAFLSPLPLFALTLRNHPIQSASALFSNLVILLLLGNPIGNTAGSATEAWVAGGLWVGVGMLFPLLIRKKSKIHSSFGWSFLFMVSLIVGGLWIQARQLDLSLIEYLRVEINTGMDRLIALPDSPVKKMVEQQGRDALFKQIMTELPSGILMSVVFCLWINLLFASQILPGFLSRSFWASFRNPHALIYPTLICAVLYTYTDHALYAVGLNGLKLALLFYGLQGLSIISHFLNRYKILGFGRLLAYSIGIFFVSPIVLILGFFDQWFDFRRKFGHS
jgi:hypothetical protein